ncbi:MAG: 4-(cytidine 5'-diphospho)-2-C-methyl-D-erythritol kinase [Candidatus Eisenbacteria bacterium]
MTVVRCAFAKVNLGLVVGPTRADGYHEVATALLAISLHDRLVFAPRARGMTLAVDGPEARGVPRDASNLVVRAALALASALGERRGAAIRLTKSIPHGAGLGGGSSDAAATLRGLLALWGRTMSPARLRALAATLGSDVPFFLGGGFALATGRGTDLRPLAPPRAGDGLTFVVVVPDAGISTRWAYASHAIPKSRLTGFGHAATLVQLRAEAFARQRVKPRLLNDLERTVRPAVGAVSRALRDLRRAGLVHARMSGSGSAVFGLVPATVAPRVAVERLQKSYARVYVARPVRAGSRPCR